jgi:hypothetical protein
MARRPQGRRCTPVRIGRVSLYSHHGSCGFATRKTVDRIDAASVLIEAERVASEVNAQLATQVPTVFGFVPTTGIVPCLSFPSP